MDITQEASVAEFQHQARQLFADIRARGKHPILVGGSGLYVRAALDKLEFPGTDSAVRTRLEQEAAQQGIGVLRTRLAQVDPDSAARVHDERRVIRALEVFEVTGRPFSAFMPVREYVSPAIQIGLDMDRKRLHERLYRRVVNMAELGLLDEVRTLEQHGLREGKTASRAIGYAQFLKVLDVQSTDPDSALSATYTLHDAIEDTATATRQFCAPSDNLVSRGTTAYTGLTPNRRTCSAKRLRSCTRRAKAVKDRNPLKQRILCGKPVEFTEI